MTRYASQGGAAHAARSGSALVRRGAEAEVGRAEEPGQVDRS